jgi:adenosylcobinamide-GDP ribazoletransferase
VTLRPVGFWSAVQFLTRIPLPPVEPRLDAALVWFPLVGLLLGGALAALDIALRSLNVQSLLASTLIVVALLVLTGALHADGLMDTSDAVFGHATPERRLEIMRDPRVGAFGVVGLVCVVTLKIAALDALPPALRTSTLLLSPTLGRWSIVLLATLFPYGREIGLGSPLKSTATRPRLAMASVLPVVACIGAGTVGVGLGVLTVLAALMFGWWLMRLLPGLTGDCYGAGCELTEALVLVTAAVLAYALA